MIFYLTEQNIKPLSQIKLPDTHIPLPPPFERMTVLYGPFCTRGRPANTKPTTQLATVTINPCKSLTCGIVLSLWKADAHFRISTCCLPTKVATFWEVAFRVCGNKRTTVKWKQNNRKITSFYSSAQITTLQ